MRQSTLSATKSSWLVYLPYLSFIDTQRRESIISKDVIIIGRTRQESSMIHSASPQSFCFLLKSWEGRTDNLFENIVITIGRDCGQPRGSKTKLFWYEKSQVIYDFNLWPDRQHNSKMFYLLTALRLTFPLQLRRSCHEIASLIAVVFSANEV